MASPCVGPLSHSNVYANRLRGRVLAPEGFVSIAGGIRMDRPQHSVKQAPTGSESVATVGATVAVGATGGFPRFHCHQLFQHLAPPSRGARVRLADVEMEEWITGVGKFDRAGPGPVIGGHCHWHRGTRLVAPRRHSLPMWSTPTPLLRLRTARHSLDFVGELQHVVQLGLDASRGIGR